MDVAVFVLIFTTLLRGGIPYFTDLILSPNLMTWQESVDYCKSINGSLIELNSQEKWDFFTSHDEYKTKDMDKGVYWTGLRFDDSIQCGQTSWRTHWVYDGWGRWLISAEEPNGCPSQRCVKLSNNWMRSTGCSVTLTALCEIDSGEPTSSTAIDSTKSDLMTTATTETAAVTSVHPSNTITTTENASCSQCCSREYKTRQLDPTERDEITRELRDQLVVNKTNLSAQRRKRTSVYDSRSSSAAMGGLACAILVAVLGFVVVPDMVTLSRFAFKWLSASFARTI